MAAPRFSADDLSRNILNEVDRELNKKASPTYIRDSGKTELGKGLSKLAEDLRNYQPGEVTWSDVAEFRRKHGR